MKKTLFVKFLFLLLCGSVLTTAGCKDYDDDIDALRNDVEDLKGTVVELNGFENRIAALEQTQAAFEAIDFSGFAKKGDISSLQTQIEGCVKDSDLAAKVVAAIESSLADGALQESLNSLKSGILEEIAGIYATQETLESVQETLENMIELKKDAAGFSLEVTQLIESYLSDNGFEAAGGELTDSQVSQIETAASQWIADAIKAELETAGSSINKWLGDELAVYMDQMTLGDNLLGQVSTQAIASVMEELDKEASALTEKIQGLIRENNGSLVISKDQLDQEFQNYLATLEANVGLLGSRIQSIVYLPDYVDGLIYFGNGEQYIVLSRENEVTHETEYRNLYLRPSAEGEQIATLRFLFSACRSKYLIKLALAEELAERAVGSVLDPTDISKALYADALDIFSQLVDLFSCESGSAVLCGDAANSAAVCDSGGKYSEAAVLNNIGKVGYLHAETCIGLIGTKALESFGIFHSGQGHRDISAKYLAEQSADKALSHFHNVLGLGKGHFKVYLSKFGLSVRTEVLITEASCQLDHRG